MMLQPSLRQTQYAGSFPVLELPMTATHLIPGLRSSTSRSRFATKSPSGPMYSVLFTPGPLAAPAAPPALAAPPAVPPAPPTLLALLLLPGLLFPLSTRDATGRPPAVTLVAPRRRAAALPAASVREDCAGCLRAHTGIRSSGLEPYSQPETGISMCMAKQLIPCILVSAWQ